MIYSGKVPFEITQLSMVAPSTQLERNKQEEMVVVGLPFFVIELNDDLLLSSGSKQSWVVKVVVGVGDGEIGG